MRASGSRLRCPVWAWRSLFFALFLGSIVSSASSQTITFGGYDAHGKPTTLKVDADITLALTYTPRGSVASVSDGRATVQMLRTPVGRVSRLTANGWLTIDFEYGERGRAKRLYDNFGNELAFVRNGAGVREDVYRHANASRSSAEYLKAVDPLVLSGLATEPAALAMALYSIALTERADLASLDLQQRVALAPVLASLLNALIPSAQAQTPNCPPRTYIALRAWVQVACKTGAPSACLPSDSCLVNTVKIARRSNRITARKTINRRCFNGGDPGHRDQVNQEISGIKECLRVRPQCCKGDEE